MKYVKCICLECGIEFPLKESLLSKGRGKFCSNSCSATYRTKSLISKLEKVCLFCNEPFYVVKSKAEKSKFCSQECYLAYKKCIKTSNKEICICQNCGQIFLEYPSRIRDGRGKFCSLECHNNWKARNRLVKTCKYCGITFSVEKNKGINNRGNSAQLIVEAFF